MDINGLKMTDKYEKYVELFENSQESLAVLEELAREELAREDGEVLWDEVCMIKNLQCDAMIDAYCFACVVGDENRRKQYLLALNSMARSLEETDSSEYMNFLSMLLARGIDLEETAEKSDKMAYFYKKEFKRIMENDTLTIGQKAQARTIIEDVLHLHFGYSLNKRKYAIWDDHTTQYFTAEELLEYITV